MRVPPGIPKVTISYRPMKRLGPECRSAGLAAAVARKKIPRDGREHFIVLLLDGKKRLVGWHEVAIGDLAQVAIAPREVFRVALLAPVDSIILAHNHPSGDYGPSARDRRTTTGLVRAGAILGVEILDHIVVADLGFTSLKLSHPGLFNG